MLKQVFAIVLDSVGIGVLLDAAEYGDYGGNIQGKRYYYRTLGIAGCPISKTLPLYPDGFPPVVAKNFKLKTLSYG